jgi:hypothetical protein
LTLLRKYRFYTSGLLLVLYSFIAMPVQFWHKHSGKAKSYALVSVNEKSSVAKEGGFASELAVSERPSIAKDGGFASELAVNQKFSAAKDGSSLSDDCRICSHQYSVYANDLCQPVLITFPYQRSSQHFSVSSLLETENLPFSNKGPPVVVS